MRNGTPSCRNCGSTASLVALGPGIVYCQVCVLKAPERHEIQTEAEAKAKEPSKGETNADAKPA